MKCSKSKQQTLSCGETKSYLGPVARWGGRTSDDTTMRGRSLGTTSSGRKGWVRDGSRVHEKTRLHMA